MSVPYTFGTNTYAQSGQLDANFAALNSGLSNIDASQITTGTLPVARGGTGATTAPAALTSLGAAPATGGSYVAKTGDTMTGPLSGTTASFSGTISATSDIHANSGTLFLAGAHTWYIQADSGGNFLIADNSASALRLEINAVGACSASSTWSVISDVSLKTDIADNRRGLADLLKVQPRRFRYARDYMPEQGTGFIAQELAEIMPELVGEIETPAGERLKTVTETGLIGPLINAVKELTARIEALEKR